MVGINEYVSSAMQMTNMFRLLCCRKTTNTRTTTYQGHQFDNPQLTALGSLLEGAMRSGERC